MPLSVQISERALQNSPAQRTVHLRERSVFIHFSNSAAKRFDGSRQIHLLSSKPQTWIIRSGFIAVKLRFNCSILNQWRQQLKLMHDDETFCCSVSKSFKGFHSLRKKRVRLFIYNRTLILSIYNIRVRLFILFIYNYSHRIRLFIHKFFFFLNI